MSWLSDLLRSPGAEAFSDTVSGAGETGAALASGMGAQALGGIGGLGTAAGNALLRAATGGKYGKDPLDAFRQTLDTAGRTFTYQPRTDIGKEGIENVGAGLKALGRPIREHVLDPVGDWSPVAGAALETGLNMIGPGKAKPRAVSSGLARELRFNPGEAKQPQLPGVEPRTKAEALAQAEAELGRTREAASFTDPQTGQRYTYEAESSRPYTSSGQEGVNSLGERGNFNWRGAPEDLDFTAGAERGTLAPEGIEAMRRGGGHEPLARMQEHLETIRGAEDVRNARLVDAARAEQAKREALIAELRGQRGQGDVFENVARERAIAEAKRALPVIEGGDTVWRAEEGRSPYFNAQGGITGRLHESRAEPGTPLAEHAERLGRQDELNVQAIRERNQVKDFLDELRGDQPEPQVPAWAERLGQSPLQRHTVSEPAGQEWWNRALGIEVDPAHMNRESVAAFLDEVRGNPEAFQYGAMPSESEFRTPKNRGGTGPLQEMADIFGERAGKEISIDEHYVDPDEEPKIKVEKEHGRGEVMRDRYGDYIERQKEHERGDTPMYDEYGDVKKDPVQYQGRELIDPETLEPTVQKRVAEGGEPLRDYRGDPKYEFVKSEGGEPVRDERGRQKYRWVDNPDYSGEEVGGLEMSTRGGDHIKISGDLFNEPSVEALSAGKSGSLLYQTLLADASRRGYDIGSSSLTSDNALRLLSNTLANYARTGVNPRDVSGTAAGRAPRARGQAEGPELWRAEAEEAKSRIKRYGGEPTALRFDPEAGYTIQGKPASLDDIKANLRELSPELGESKVGLKTLQRAAVFDWLRNASVDAARAAAREVGKGYGPLFLTGQGPAGLAALLREQGGKAAGSVAGTALKQELQNLAGEEQ